MWQTASDFFIFLGWLWQNTTLILKSIFLPVQYIFTFIKTLFTSAVAQPIIPDTIWNFDSGVLAVFNAIPYWSTITLVLSVSLTILIVFFALRTFLRS